MNTSSALGLGIVVGILVAGVPAFVLYQQNLRLQQDAADQAARANTLQTQVDTLEGRVSTLETERDAVQRERDTLQQQVTQQSAQVATLQVQVDTLQGQVQALNAQLAHPRLPMWNACGELADPSACPMTGGGWRVGTVPDTFEYEISFTSTVPVTVYFLTLAQYVEFATCGRIGCVSGTYQFFPATTMLEQAVFTLATGCASYVAVFQSLEEGVLYPDVWIIYNPAAAPTGSCAEP
jgi:outer membrane murein-binding lipoprotein Lpp